MDPDRRKNGKEPVEFSDGKDPVVLNPKEFCEKFFSPNPINGPVVVDLSAIFRQLRVPRNDIYDFDYGALELYYVEESGGDDVCKITVDSNLQADFPTDTIFEYNSGQKVPILRGPNYHLTCSYTHTFKFHYKSGEIKTQDFVLEWDGIDEDGMDADEMDGVDIVRTKKIYDTLTVCYQWIMSPARANFQFSFCARDASTRHTIQNLRGWIDVFEADKEGTTRRLAVFYNNDCCISGETLPLLRSSAAFPAGKRFGVCCNLSFCVDGSPKLLSSSNLFRSPQKDRGVYSEEGLNKAKKDPNLHQEYEFGSQFPKLKMHVFWLTSMMREYPLS